TEFYGLLMESSLSAKIVVDAKGVVVDYNPAAQTLLGFTRDEIIGADMAEHIIPLRWRADHVQGFERFLQVGAGEVIARRVEFAALHKNGGEIPVELTINAINTDQGMYFGTEIRDLRDWRALEQEMRGAREQAEQANMSKSRFLATMSHEIRTPLNALLGILGMAKADEKDAHQLSLLVTAETAAQRLMRLLSNVLDYSKVEAGEMSNDLRAICPATLVQDVADLLGPNLHGGGVELACSFGAAKDLWVLGDAQKVTQIVTNLVSNAVKFTEQGRIDIALDCDEPNAANACYRIKVRDSGIGMTQMQLDKVFDAFVQVDDSDRRKYLGSGLGLSISKQLALLMHGQLTVTSAPKQGSEFVLTLPLSAMTKPVEVFSTETITADASGSRRVLVVEDSKPNQLVVKAMLERHGYVVDVVDDGIEACAAMKRKGQGSTAYGLILMDVQMPGMDGLEATRWIRNNGYSQPIIALTAKAFMEDEKACLQAGMNDFMAKPVNYEALLNRVDMWLAQQADLSSTVLSEKVEEMRVLLGDSALHEALTVFVLEVEQRHATLQAALQREDLAAAAAELHTLFGIYAGYGFDDLGHMCRGLEDSCVAELMPQSSALAHFANMSEQLLQKIPAYQGELSSADKGTPAVLGDSS
ncbi:MAG: response regulator, partial [Proteobacteria bacterium]|nr:response regulator [Pseudomonadota bacterium]